MATVSLFAISLGVASGAARILYAQARDATGTRTGLAGLSKNGAPAVALVVVIAIIGVNLIASSWSVSRSRTPPSRRCRSAPC